MCFSLFLYVNTTRESRKAENGKIKSNVKERKIGKERERNRQTDRRKIVQREKAIWKNNQAYGKTRNPQKHKAED